MRLKHVAVFTIAVASFGALSAGDTYQLDASHTSVGFKVRHLSISNTKGTFPKVTGTLVLDETNIGQSSVEVAIDAASVDTNDDKRDEHLRGADFFDIAKTPSITFKSKRVAKTGNSYKATGDLTIKGVTKSVEIPFTMSPPTAHPMAPVTVIGVEGALTINRRDFNILYAPSAVIGDEIKIELAVEFTRPQEGRK